MRDITYFSAETVAKFENSYDNMLQFNEVMLDGAHKIYNRYTKEETDKIIREQFNNILGIDFKTADKKARRQAWRKNKVEIYNLIEDVLVDLQKSGWNATNARFMDFVETKNLADGDQNEFYVSDNTLLQVSKFAGDHHDINSYSVRVA